MIRPPILPQDQGGGYEGMGPAFTGEPIGTRMSTPAGRQAEMANLANAVGFLSNPFTTMAAYALTGQSPAQFFNVGDWRTAQGVPQGAETQGIVPPSGVSRLFGGVRNFLFGPPQQSVSLAEAQGGPSQQTLGMAAQSATNIADMYGLSPEQAAQVGQTAAGLVAQGMNITEAITLAANYGAYSARPDMAGSPFGQPAAQPAAPQFAPQGPSQAAMAQMASGAADMYGKPISADAVAVNPIGGGGQIESSYDFGGGNVANNSGISYDMSDFGFR
jgi:hypothetical protein